MKCCQREENKAEKGEESKWGKVLIFLCEELSLLILLPLKLDDVPGVWRRELIHDMSFSSWLMTSTGLGQLTNLSVQCLEISATQREALEYLNQKGSWLLLWWQCLGPAWQRFLNKPFLIIDFHVLWLHSLVLSLNHGYVFFLGWQNNSFMNLNCVGYGGYVCLGALAVFPRVCWDLVCPSMQGQEKPRIHLSCFSWPFDLQHHVFISSVYLKGGCWPPASLHPSISATSFHFG